MAEIIRCELCGYLTVYEGNVIIDGVEVEHTEQCSRCSRLVCPGCVVWSLTGDAETVCKECLTESERED